MGRLKLSVNRTTGKSPFEVVYGRNPITLLDLVPIREVGRFSDEGADQSEQIKELHWSVREQIIRHNEQYKEDADKHLSPYRGDSDDEPDWGSILFNKGRMIQMRSTSEST
ncbi:hypothetical protein Tco_1529622 [Tanacetum coccineum]